MKLFINDGKSTANYYIAGFASEQVEACPQFLSAAQTGKIK